MENQELLLQLAAMLEQQTESIEKRFEQQTVEIKIYIENNVEKKIEALFDGYKLVHEKQWELDRQQQILKNDLDALKSEVLALKEKVS